MGFVFLKFIKERWLESCFRNEWRMRRLCSSSKWEFHVCSEQSSLMSARRNRMICSLLTGQKPISLSGVRSKPPFFFLYFIYFFLHFLPIISLCGEPWRRFTATSVERMEGSPPIVHTWQRVVFHRLHYHYFSQHPLATILTKCLW